MAASLMNLRFFSLLLLAGTLSAQQLPSPPKAHLSDITPKAGFFNEPAIAVNTKDALQLAVAWQVNASVAYSNDGGMNWTTAAGTAPKDYRISGDVSITYDAAGHAHGLLVLTLADDRSRAIAGFIDDGALARFWLPRTLPEQDQDLPSERLRHPFPAIGTSQRFVAIARGLTPRRQVTVIRSVHGGQVAGIRLAVCRRR